MAGLGSIVGTAAAWVHTDAVWGFVAEQLGGEYQPAEELFPQAPDPQNLDEARASMARPWHDPRQIREIPGNNQVVPAERIRRMHPLVEADPAFREIHTIHGKYDPHQPLTHEKLVQAIQYFTGVDLADHESVETFPKNLRAELSDDEILRILDFFGEEAVTDEGRAYRIEMGRAGWTDPLFFETDIDDVAVRGNGASRSTAQFVYRFPQAINHFIRQLPIPILKNLSTETVGIYWGGVEMMAQATPKDLHILSWLRSGRTPWGRTDNAHRNMFRHAENFPSLRILNGLLPYQRPDIRRDFVEADGIFTSSESGLAISDFKNRLHRKFQAWSTRRVRSGALIETEVGEPPRSRMGRFFSASGIERQREKPDDSFFTTLDRDDQDRLALLFFGPKAHKIKQRQAGKTRESKLEHKPEFHVENAQHHAESMVRTGRSTIRVPDRRMSLLGGNFFTYDPLRWLDKLTRWSGYGMAEALVRLGRRDWSDTVMRGTRTVSRTINRTGTLNNIPLNRDGINRHIVEGARLIRSREGDEAILVEYNPKPTQISSVVGAASNIAGAWLAAEATLKATPDALLSQVLTKAQDFLTSQPAIADVMVQPWVYAVLHSSTSADLLGASALAVMGAVGASGKSLAGLGLAVGRLIYLPMHPDAAEGVRGIRIQRVESEALTFREMAESHERNHRQAKIHIRELKDFFRYEVAEYEAVRRHYKAMMTRKIKVIRPEGGGSRDKSPEEQSVDRWARLRAWRDRIRGNLRG